MIAAAGAGANIQRKPRRADRLETFVACSWIVLQIATLSGHPLKAAGSCQKRLSAAARLKMEPWRPALPRR